MEDVLYVRDSSGGEHYVNWAAIADIWIYRSPSVGSVGNEEAQIVTLALQPQQSQQARAHRITVKGDELSALREHLRERVGARGRESVAFTVDIDPDIQAADDENIRRHQGGATPITEELEERG